MAKTVLITGGTTGIGWQSALLFGKRGWNVAFTSRNEERGKKREEELKAMGVNALFLQLDVTREEDVKKTIGAVVKHYGRMDSIINNGAISNDLSLLGDFDSKMFAAMLDTNVLGLFYCMKYAIHHYLEVGGGNIVNLASIAGLHGIPYAVPYCATKHAVVGLTKGAAVEYATKNIRVNAVAPGTVDTDIIKNAYTLGIYNKAQLEAIQPMNRLGRPEEIAAAIVFLASDEASFVTGSIFSVDGGVNAL